ncbi:hypothetical protein [Paraburkholderia diazotrophica]|uniref:hypothetical protein n=1 Tax=Paraburkholderia diazotrophica TaxID=667676 RepID=UPI00115FC6B2|nr:hypothetical protein [Paraburkholderia diazotrophica]
MFQTRPANFSEAVFAAIGGMLLSVLFFFAPSKRLIRFSNAALCSRARPPAFFEKCLIDRPQAWLLKYADSR